MLKKFMRKGVAIYLAGCMLIGLCPIMDVSAEVTAPAFYNILFEEDFEDGASSFEFSNSSAKSTNVITTECASTDDSGYGMGSYNLPIVNSDDNYIIRSFLNGSESMKAISMIDYTHSESTETYGYSVELSFDWNPYDIGSAPKTVFSITGNPDPQPETYQDKPVMGITYTGGNTETSGRTIVVTNNNRTNNIGEYDLTEILGDEIWDIDHVYRVRFVFNTYSTAKEVDGTKYAGSCTIYIDGVMLGTFDYIRNKDRDYLVGIHFESNKKQANVIDNIRLIEYWNSLDSGEVYKNDDLIVAEIRAAESKYEKLSDADKETADTAIAAAKSVHADEESTQGQLNSAAVELKEVMDALNEEQGGSGEDEEPENPPAGEYEYIVNNDFEGTETAPFSGGFETVTDSSEIMGNVMKVEDTTGILSDVFEGVNIITDTGNAKRDSVFEFDIKLKNYNPEDGMVTLTQWDARYRESVGQQISKLSFSDDGITRETGSTTDTEPLTISQADLSDGKWHRIKIVNHSWFAENDQNMYRMSLYIDGECEYPHIRRKSFSKGKVDEFSQFEIAGIPDEAVVYLDNIKVYSTTTSSENIPADAGKLMKTVWDIESFLDTAVIGTEEGTYNSEDISELQAVYDEAVAAVPTLKTQAEVDTKFNELMSVLSGIRPIGDDIAVDSLTYSADNLAADGVTEVTASVTVSTTRNAPSENDFTMITALYRNSDSFSGGELVSMSSDTVTLGAKQAGIMTATVDISGYTADERAEMYVKTVVLTGEGRTQVMETEGSIVGSEDENTAYTENLYGESAEIFKKVLSDGTVKISLSLESEVNDDIIVYVSKNGENLADIAQNDIESKFAYFNIINTGDDGEVVCEFAPDAEGEYTVVAYSLKQGREIYSAICIYKEKSALEAALDELKNNEKDISTHKALLDLDTEKFDISDKNGIDMDGLAEYILGENPNADVYEFKSEYLKNMNMLYSIKTAGNTDEVLATLKDYNVEPSGVSAYQIRNIGAYIYKNKANATTMDNFDKLLAYRPSEGGGGSGGGSGGGGGGGSSSGGGIVHGGNGYINTSEEAVPQNPVTPYEQATGTFKDLYGFDWAKEAIMFMANKNVINGKSAGVFAPADYITREEFAKIVVNMFGIPSGDKAVTFSDVDVNGWYYPYVKTAYSSGIVNGIGNNMFGTGTLISREDACVMLYRAGGYINVEYSDKAEFIPFEDECSDYAREAVEALAKSGIVKGTGNNVLQAAKPLTRAEAAKMVYELYSFAQ